MKTNYQQGIVTETLLMLWFLFVYFSYQYFHQGLIFFLLILATGLLFLAFWKYTIKPMKKQLFNFHINKPLWQASLLTTGVILGLAIFIRLIGNFHTEKLSPLPLLKTEFFVVTNILVKIIFLSASTILSAGVGKKIFNIFKFKIDDLKEEFVFSFGLGFLIINYLSFFITALGWLYFWPSLIMILILAFISWSEIRYFIGLFLKTNFKFNISTDFYNKDNLRSWIIVLIIFFLSISFLTTIRSFATTADDLTAYFSVPQTYKYYHRLVPFYNSTQSIASGVAMTLYAITDTILSPTFTFTLTWLFFVFLLYTIYLFTKKFFSESVATISILLITFIPWNYFFVTTQKIEFIFSFISAIIIFLFFEYLNKKQTKWLYLSAVFLGYSINLKMNGIFLLITLSIVLLTIFYFKKIKLKSGLIFSLIVTLFCLPIFLTNLHYYNNPLAPYWQPKDMFNTNTHKNINIFNQKKVSIYDIVSQDNLIGQKKWENTKISRQNNISNSSIINFFWMIWNTTTNQKGVRITYVEISPYLLIFLPFFTFYFFRDKLYKQKNIIQLSFVSLIFFIIWCWKGAERPWYGIAMFYFFFIFCAIVLQKLNNKTYKNIIYFLITVFCFGSVLNTASAFNLTPNEIYYTPQWNKQDAENKSYIKMAKFVNDEIIDKNKRAMVLLFLESKGSHFKESSTKTILDSNGIYWGELIQEAKSFDQIKQILINQGITHIMYAVRFKHRMNYLNEGKDKSNYFIFKEIEIFEQFKDQYLKELKCIDNAYCIYKI